MFTSDYINVYKNDYINGRKHARSLQIHFEVAQLRLQQNWEALFLFMFNFLFQKLHFQTLFLFSEFRFPKPPLMLHVMQQYCLFISWFIQKWFYFFGKGFGAGQYFLIMFLFSPRQSADPLGPAFSCFVFFCLVIFMFVNVHFIFIFLFF